jgi:hypothetical protein
MPPPIKPAPTNSGSPNPAATMMGEEPPQPPPPPTPRASRKRSAGSVRFDTALDLLAHVASVRQRVADRSLPRLPDCQPVPSTTLARNTPGANDEGVNATTASLAPAQSALDARYGRDSVAMRRAHDVFDSDTMLARQLAHEHKPAIDRRSFEAIQPFALPPGQRVFADVGPQASARPATAQPSQVDGQWQRHRVLDVDERIVGTMAICINDSNKVTALQSNGAFGVPPGWQIEDKLTTADGVIRLRSTLTGPNGESGMVVRGFDGVTLYLEKAYKCSLPSRLANVPTFAGPVATINYLSARACRIMGVTHDNLQHIRISRLQHQPLLLHLDWLRRRYPQRPLEELIDHTTWARTYIRDNATMVGKQLQPTPAISLQGSPGWVAAHPDATLRDFNYLRAEGTRQMIKHLTGANLPKVDDPVRDWRTAASDAMQALRAWTRAGGQPATAAAPAVRISAKIRARLTATRTQETQLRQRYDLPKPMTPQHLNFDVTFSLRG